MVKENVYVEQYTTYNICMNKEEEQKIKMWKMFIPTESRLEANLALSQVLYQI